MIRCNKSTFYRRMGIFIVASCDVDRHLNSVRTIRYFSVYTTFPRRMFMSRGNLKGSRTRRYDFASVKRGDSVGRHFHYKDGRFWVDQAARMPLEYVCETLVKGAAWPRTRNIFIKSFISTIPDSTGMLSHAHFSESESLQTLKYCDYLQYYGIQNALRNIYIMLMRY